MSTYTVYRQYYPVLVIEGVPEDEEITWEMLEQAGYRLGDRDDEADHVLERIDDEGAPSRLVAHVRRGDYKKRITWQEFKARLEPPEGAVIISVHLGSGAKGALRKDALERLAQRGECYWDGKPSIGRWIVAQADEELERLSEPV